MIFLELMLLSCTVSKSGVGLPITAAFYRSEIHSIFPIHTHKNKLLIKHDGIIELSQTPWRVAIAPFLKEPWGCRAVDPSPVPKLNLGPREVSLAKKGSAKNHNNR